MAPERIIALWRRKAIARFKEAGRAAGAERKYTSAAAAWYAKAVEDEEFAWTLILYLEHRNLDQHVDTLSEAAARSYFIKGFDGMRA